MAIVKTTRRRRRKRPTSTPRFGPTSVAYEIGLIRMTLDLKQEALPQRTRKAEDR